MPAAAAVSRSGSACLRLTRAALLFVGAVHALLAAPFIVAATPRLLAPLPAIDAAAHGPRALELLESIVIDAAVWHALLAAAAAGLWLAMVPFRAPSVARGAAARPAFPAAEAPVGMKARRSTERSAAVAAQAAEPADERCAPLAADVRLAALFLGLHSMWWSSLLLRVLDDFAAALEPSFVLHPSATPPLTDVLIAGTAVGAIGAIAAFMATPRGSGTGAASAAAAADAKPAAAAAAAPAPAPAPPATPASAAAAAAPVVAAARALRLARIAASQGILLAPLFFVAWRANVLLDVSCLPHMTPEFAALQFVTYPPQIVLYAALAALTTLGVGRAARWLLVAAALHHAVSLTADVLGLIVVADIELGGPAFGILLHATLAGICALAAKRASPSAAITAASV